MPVVPGKNGTIRVRGRVRAQARVCLDKCEELLAANNKYNALPNPPNPPLLTAPQAASVTACYNVMVAVLDQKNMG